MIYTQKFRASWSRRFHAGRSRVLFVQLHLAYLLDSSREKKNILLFLSYYLPMPLGFQQSMGGHRAENDKRLRSACNSNNTRVRKTDRFLSYVLFFILFSRWLVERQSSSLWSFSTMASRRRRLFLYTRDPRKALTRTRWTSDDSLLFSWWLLVVNSLLNKMFLISQLISFLNLFQEGREGVGLYNKWMQCFCCCHSIHTHSLHLFRPWRTRPDGILFAFAEKYFSKK
jgi:hypothetical protein